MNRKYRDELYGDREVNALRNFGRRRGSLGLYDLQNLPNDIANAYSILRQLWQDGRLFVEKFNFPEYGQMISEFLEKRANYSQVPEHLMSTVKRLHEELGGNEVASLFEGLGIMSIRTGAPIPKPKNGQAQKDILILVAHPDDAEIMYGAQALHEMVENRSIMHYFVLFPGTAGGDDRGFTQLGAPILRAVELIAAARKLGIPWVHFFCGPEVNEEGFPENFGLREWLGSLALKNSEDAAFLLGLALARTFVADEVWGHVANSAIDWHRDHFFAALMADAYAAFGQWVAYMHCLVDTRKRVPAGVLRVFGVVWENSEKLAQTLKTVYYRHTKTGRLTHLASLILESLDTHWSQNGLNYAIAKLNKEQHVGMMSDINNPNRPSCETAFANGFSRTVEITLRGAVSRYARLRLAFIRSFSSIEDFILTPVEDYFDGLTD